MPEKIVYNPKEHASNQNNVGSKKATKNPKPTKTTKAKKKNEKDVVDAKAHAEDGADVKPEPVTQFKAKLNKYGFIRVPKKARSSLPFEPEKPLIARIDGDHLTIAAATK